MNNRIFPLIVFGVMVILTVFLVNYYNKEYSTAWKESPNSSLAKYSAIALSVGFIIASIGIFSWHAFQNGGYSIFRTTYSKLWPFVVTALATVVMSVVLMWSIYPFSSFIRFNTPKVGTVVTAVIGVLLLFGQNCWLKSEINEKDELEKGKGS